MFRIANHNMSMKPVVIFGAHIAGYGVIRALAPQGIPLYLVSEKNNMVCCRSRYIRKQVCLEAGDAGFLYKLRRWMRETGIGSAVAIVAGSDEYLDVLSKNIDGLADIIIPTYPDWSDRKSVV